MAYYKQLPQDDIDAHGSRGESLEGIGIRDNLKVSALLQS